MTVSDSCYHVTRYFFRRECMSVECRGSDIRDLHPPLTLASVEDWQLQGIKGRSTQQALKPILQPNLYRSNWFIHLYHNSEANRTL